MPFTVDEFHDLLRLLQERPEWRAELRRVVLTDELLALPVQVAEFRAETERRFQELAQAQARTEQRVEALAQAQARTEKHVAALAEAQARTEEQVQALSTRVTQLAEAQARTEEKVQALSTRVTQLAEAQARTEIQLTALAEQVAKLAQRLEGLTIEVGELKGMQLEADYRVKGHAYFSRLVRRPHVLSADEVTTLVEDAQDRGILSEAEARELYDTDLIVRGKKREDGTEVYLVVEVSWGVGLHDVERVLKRAALLARLGTAVMPVVAGKRLTADAIRSARTQQVWQVTDGYAVPPESAEAQT
ncbi:MAG: hypothetical protein NZ578_01955 [Candidatus Binatia bacterium]|nr:hypothetical protein [Candidatus Binatia bacterium]